MSLRAYNGGSMHLTGTLYPAVCRGHAIEDYKE